MILTKQLMAPCRLMRLPIRQSSRCTSMDISVTPINLASLQMVLASSVTLLFITKTSFRLIRTSLLKRNLILQMNTNLGDAAFDAIKIYKTLFEEIGFQKAFIPLKTKLTIEGIDYTVNENGIPCCPHDPSLPMRREGSRSHLRSKLPTMKFVCPKMKWEYNPADKSKHRVCHCDNPCTSSSCGRMIYIYPEKNLRAYPGVERGSQEWEDTYKIRVNVEKSINHFKDSFCIADRKTQNEKTLHADLLLAGITQLVTVLVADKIHQYQYIRSLKPLIA